MLKLELDKLKSVVIISFCLGTLGQSKATR